MTCALNCRGDPALEFQRVAGDAPGQELALWVDKLQEEVRITVVNIANAVFLEAAVFFPLFSDVGVVEKFDIVS